MDPDFCIRRLDFIDRCSIKSSEKECDTLDLGQSALFVDHKLKI